MAAVVCALCGQSGLHDCALRVVPCLYEAECKWRGLRRDRAAHLAGCAAAEVLCPFAEPATGETCGARVSRHSLEAHQLDCRLRPARCRTCAGLFTLASLPAHTQTCALVSDVCASCGALVRRALRSAHQCSTPPSTALGTTLLELDASLSAMAGRAATLVPTEGLAPAGSAVPVAALSLGHSAELLQSVLSQVRGELADADAAAVTEHLNRLDVERTARLRAYEAAATSHPRRATVEELAAARLQLSQLQAAAHTKAFAASAASAESVDGVSRECCKVSKEELEECRQELASHGPALAWSSHSRSTSLITAEGSELAVLHALEVPFAALEAAVAKASAQVGLTVV